jgi:uncharacterized protein (DUF2236 family)
MHDHVKGANTKQVMADGETKPYKAVDPDLLAWVHIAFTDSFSDNARTLWRRKNSWWPR